MDPEYIELLQAKLKRAEKTIDNLNKSADDLRQRVLEIEADNTMLRKGLGMDPLRRDDPRKMVATTTLTGLRGHLVINTMIDEHVLLMARDPEAELAMMLDGPHRKLGYSYFREARLKL